jgi:hypothetical protein
MRDVDTDRVLTAAEIADLVAKTSAVVNADKRFHYFGTPEFHKRLCRLDDRILVGMVMTTKRMAMVAGAPPELFAEFIEHFLISRDVALLYAGSDRVVAVPRGTE